jgi:hypothetical protein
MDMLSRPQLGRRALAFDAALALVLLAGAVGHLDHETGPRIEHEWHRPRQGDEVRVHPHLQHAEAACEIVLPHRRVHSA